MVNPGFGDDIASRITVVICSGKKPLIVREGFKIADLWGSLQYDIGVESKTASIIEHKNDVNRATKRYVRRSAILIYVFWFIGWSKKKTYFF